jgi:hypothetical protein
MNYNERLELVTDFASLKAGDYVEVRRCVDCGATHRGILVAFDDDCESGFDDDTDGWEYLPSSCLDGAPSAVGRSTVSQRRLYLIDTGLEQEDVRKRKSVRA